MLRRFRHRHSPLALSPFGILLVACGGGGSTSDIDSGNDSNSSNSAQINDLGSSQSDFTANSQELLTFRQFELDIFSGTYETQDQLSSPPLDQTFSESYLSGWKDNTSLVNLSGTNEIDGLLYADVSYPNKTDFWKVQGPENYISFSFFDTNLLLLDEDAYTGNDLVEAVYYNDFYEITAAKRGHSACSK